MAKKNNNFILAGAAIVAGVLILRGSDEQDGGGGPGGGGFFFGPSQPPLLTDPIGVTPGLIAMSGDEDIGIAPAPGFADNSPTGPAGAVGVQRQNVSLIGTQQTGFDLMGGINLQGDSPIQVTSGGELIGAFGDFATTPDVLARYIDEVAFAPTAPNAGNTFSLSGALLADPNFEITQFSLDADPAGAELLRRQSVDLDLGI